MRRRTGALVWEKRYNGPANNGDIAYAAVVDSNGNVVVAGTSQGDCYTAKYAAEDGALLWEKRGPNSVAYALAVDGAAM
jgi:outer membrane protein assembly factor BamB